MVQNNKVLTVSYGTFSCTLEGFDDSFETMKAIAEYFRDLAADDRYFGSEPPQPDTEMLTRIAQREASRKVEARHSDSGLLIRATEQAAAQPVVSTPDLNVVNTPAPSAPTPPAFSDAEPVEDTPAPAADSIAAKLQRIRAVVSHSEENSVIYSEDEETTLMKNAAGPSDAVAAAFEAGSLDPADLEDATASAPKAGLEEAIEDAPVAAFEEEQGVPVETSEAGYEEAPIEAQETEQDVEDAVTEPAMPQDDEIDQPEASEIEVEAEDPVMEDSAEDEDTQSDEFFSDFEETAEDEGEDIFNILDDTESDEDGAEPEDVTAGILTEEDEINLLDEISSVENILAARAAQPKSEADLDQDAVRLMDKVGEQMDDPDTTNKRETYSHLRAAVAATEAERKETGGTVQDASDHEFRDDLSSVVSPRRPEIQVTSMRPETVAAAPLKLVAEQRIDNQEDAGPVMPRRVTSQAPEDTAEEGGFAMFAQEQGAQSLPDLLEAAAAYLSFIEGQEQFSRPQLMNKIRSLKQDDFNREESLRSFGQLLRDGKIEKAGGGRFAASTQIGFRPDNERAAG